MLIGRCSYLPKHNKRVNYRFLCLFISNNIYFFIRKDFDIDIYINEINFKTELHSKHKMKQMKKVYMLVNVLHICKLSIFCGNFGFLEESKSKLFV